MQLKVHTKPTRMESYVSYFPGFLVFKQFKCSVCHILYLRMLDDAIKQRFIELSVIILVVFGWTSLENLLKSNVTINKLFFFIFQFVDEQFASELEKAIFQSKIDFEEKSNFYNCLGKAEKEKEKVSSNSRERSPTKQQHQKPLKLSLDAFNSLQPDQIDNFQNLSLQEIRSVTSPTKDSSKESILPKENSSNKQETNFFDQLDEDTKRAINREQIKDSFKMQMVRNFKMRCKF